MTLSHELLIISHKEEIFSNVLMRNKMYVKMIFARLPRNDIARIKSELVKVWSYTKRIFL